MDDDAYDHINVVLRLLGAAFSILGVGLGALVVGLTYGSFPALLVLILIIPIGFCWAPSGRE